MAADTAISAECARLIELIRKQCPGQLPVGPLPPGTVGAAIQVTSDQLGDLVRAAAIVAAGIDPLSAVPTAMPVVKWQEGDRELLIYPAGVTCRLATGVIAVTIPVSCDQTGDVAVYVSFVVGNPQAPAGLIATTHARPSGPAVVVDAWSHSLVAFAWHIVLEVVANVAGAAGRDLDGSRLVPIALAVSTAGLSIVPMARHTFDRTRG